MGDFYITYKLITYYGGFFLHNMGDYYISWGILHNMGDFYITWGIITYYGGLFLHDLGDCYTIIYERFLIRMLKLYLYSRGSL